MGERADTNLVWKVKMLFCSEKRFITIREFSEFFGYSEKHTRKLVHEGKIPGVRIKLPSGRGGDWRIDLSSVLFEWNSHDNGSAEDGLTDNGVPHADNNSIHREHDGQSPIKRACTRSLIEKINMM